MIESIAVPDVVETHERVQCDSCSARAVFLVDLPYGSLAFCNHHYNKNCDALTKQGGIAKLLGIAE